MKRSSTIQPTSNSSSGTTPISFAAAAAQKSTPKPTPPTPTPATTAATPPTTSASTTTPSSAGQAAATHHQQPTATPHSTPKPAAAPSQAPSTSNGINYSAVAAKHASNRRSQAPTAAAAVKGQPAKAAPTSGSPASSIRFGSINDTVESPAVPEESAPVPATSAAMTFGSISTSKRAPSVKAEETPAPTAPVVAAQDAVHAPAAHPSEQTASFKPIPQHVQHQQQQQQHTGSHRRTDSASSAHANEGNHQYAPYRAQVPPTISQAPIQTSGPASFTPQRPPIKNQGMPVNPQAQHHNMLPQHPQQWNQQYYMPTFEPGYYQQPMYTPQMPAYGVPQRQSMPSRPFNTNAPAFTPVAQVSKRIAIINPDTKTEVKPLPSATPAVESKSAKPPVVIDMKNPEEEKKAIITPPPQVKNVIKIVNPADRAREEKERKEQEEKTRKEKEEKERKEQEEKERLEREAKEAEERRIREEKAEKERIEALARAEKERKEKEEREAKEKAEREEKERVEAERKRKEEEERVAREKAEAEKARLEKEKADKEKAEREAKEKEVAEKLEAERRIAVETEKLAEKLKQEKAAEEAEALAKANAEKAAVTTAAETPAAEAPKTEAAPADSAKAGLSVDLSRTASAPASTPSARIENFGSVSYPAHIQSPVNAEGQGKFRYDRDFLMQFMSVCTDKPDSLPSLEALAGDDERRMQSPGSRGGPRGPMANGRGKPNNGPMGSMGSFGRDGPMKMGGMPMGMRNASGDGRLSGRSPSDSNFMPRNNLSRPPSQRGSRGGRRGGGQGRGGDREHQQPALTIPLADIVPLEKTENAWTPAPSAGSLPATISADEVLTQEQVARKVKGLLNKLTLEKFDSISDKVIDIANLSTKENDGTTLKHCIQIIFEKATDEPNFGSVYAALCHKLMEKVSPDVKDASVEGSTGGKLFRKYLLHRCQDDFVKGWKDKASAGGVALNDKDGPDLMSDEYYVMMKAKRQGLGLIHFIGELFKLNMLTEKIMHECVKKLLANVKDPEEEETEGLCKLMTTVGLQLDRPEAKGHMDVYFARMVELTKNTKLASRIRFMVQDVIDLRANKWVNRRAATGPKTIAAIHEEAAKQAEEKEMMRRAASSGGARGLPNRREQLSRGPSFRGGSGDARHDMGGVQQVGADGWSMVGNTPQLPKKAGDLSSFGNTARSKAPSTSLGPQGSVFGSLNKGKREPKNASPAEPARQLTSNNLFAALEGDSGDRRGSVDAEKPVERRRLQLLPRSAPVNEESASENKEAAPAAPKKTEDEAKRSIENTLKEYLSHSDMAELLTSVKELDAVYRPLFVKEFVNQAMEMKQSDVDRIGAIFKKLSEDKVISVEEFENGFSEPLEFLEDTAIDVPNAYKYAAQLLESAGMDPAKAAKQ